MVIKGASPKTNLELALKYMKPIILSKGSFSNEGYFEEVSKRFNLDYSRYYDTYPPRMEKAMRFYCTLFDVFEEGDGKQNKLAKFKGRLS